MHVDREDHVSDALTRFLAEVAGEWQLGEATTVLDGFSGSTAEGDQ